VFPALCGLIAALGCSGADPPIDAAGAAGSSFGRVTVQASHNHDTDAVRVSASALFVRWRGLAESTVRTLLSLPGFGVDDLRPGDCRLLDQAAAMGYAAGGRADIQLLDAGDLTLLTPDHLWALAPRRYPDVLPTLSGFVYGAASDLAPGDRFAVHGRGGAEIGLFHAGTEAPREVRMVAVAGLEATPGIVLRRGVDASVRLDAAADDTYVELQIGSTDALMALRCRTLGGVATLPAAYLAELPRGEAVLAGVRWVTAPLRIAGGANLRQGELWVEYRDELAVGLR